MVGPNPYQIPENITFSDVNYGGVSKKFYIGFGQSFYDQLFIVHPKDP